VKNRTVRFKQHLKKVDSHPAQLFLITAKKFEKKSVVAKNFP